MLKTRFFSFLRNILPFFILVLLCEFSYLLSREAKNLIKTLGFWVDVQGIILSVMAFAFLNIPLILAERFWPGTNSKRNYLEGMKFWFIYLVLTYFWSKIAILLKADLGLEPVIAWKIQSDSSAFVIALGILASMLVYDFFYYWFHRAQHHFAILWRFHRTHHSIVNLNCINSYHHITEIVLRLPFVTIPLLFLIKINVTHLILLSAFVSTWALYIHSDTRIHLGKLRSIFADNAYHRIHHSLLDHHINKNFAAFYPIWDKLFGTYQPCDIDKFPPVGISYLPPPVTVYDYIFTPFRKQK